MRRPARMPTLLQGWKLKQHLFHTFSQKLLSQFSKVLGQFCNIALRGNADVGSLSNTPGGVSTKTIIWVPPPWISNMPIIFHIITSVWSCKYSCTKERKTKVNELTAYEQWFFDSSGKAILYAVAVCKFLVLAISCHVCCEFVWNVGSIHKRRTLTRGNRVGVWGQKVVKFQGKCWSDVEMGILFPTWWTA